MIAKIFKCETCDISFERTEIDAKELVKCPLCGNKNVVLIETHTKQECTEQNVSDYC